MVTEGVAGGIGEGGGVEGEGEEVGRTGEAEVDWVV